MKPIGPIWGRAKAQSNANQSLTRRQSLRRPDLNTTLVQAKYENRGPRMRYEQAHRSRSPRSHGTSGCPNYPPTPKSRTPWKLLEMCKQRRDEISIEGNHHLHIQYSAPTELAAFMRKKHLSSNLTAHKSLSYLQNGLNGTSIQTILPETYRWRAKMQWAGLYKAKKLPCKGRCTFNTKKKWKEEKTETYCRKISINF